MYNAKQESAISKKFNNVNSVHITSPDNAIDILASGALKPLAITKNDMGFGAADRDPQVDAKYVFFALDTDLNVYEDDEMQQAFFNCDLKMLIDRGAIVRFESPKTINKINKKYNTQYADGAKHDEAFCIINMAYLLDIANEIEIMLDQEISINDLTIALQ